MGNLLFGLKDRVLSNVDASNQGVYTIFSRGDNSYGNITHLNRNDLHIVKLWICNFQCFAVDIYGSLMSWGLNDYYQLGNGQCIDYAFPNKYPKQNSNFIDTFSYISYEKNQVKSYLSPLSYFSGSNDIEFPFLGKEVKQVSCGDGFSFFLLDSGALYAVGRCDKGQLGIDVPFEKAKIVSGVRCLGSPEEVSFFKERNIKIADIKCGSDFVYCCDENGKYYSWGYNDHHQLLRETINFASPLPEEVDALGNFTKINNFCLGWMHGCFLSNNKLYIFGNPFYDYDNNYKDIKTPQNFGSSGENLIKIVSGFHHIVGLAVSNQKYNVVTIGANDFGQLGYMTDERYTTVFNKVVIKEESEIIADCYAGAFHTIVRYANGAIWGFGQNDDGQVGDYSNESIFWPTKFNWKMDSDLEIADILCANASTVILKKKQKVSDKEDESELIPINI